LKKMLFLFQDIGDNELPDPIFYC
jgi:hypothetical protein